MKDLKRQVLWFLVETLAAAGGRGGSRLVMGKLSSRARTQERAGDLEGALSACRDAAFLLPEDDTIGGEMKRASQAFEGEEEEREVEVREELGLSCKSFRKIRTDHFLVFTDMPGGREWDRWLEPVLRVLEGILTRYREMWGMELTGTK